MGATWRRPVAAAIGMLSLALVAATACTPRTGSDDVPARDIKTVMEAHVDELMAIPSVVGVAIGETPAGVPCIQVLVSERTPEVEKRVPKTLEGHPVVLVESGVIEPMR